ncbi:DUF1822 family protein [Leptolyngbya sp. FACHB-321]|uniref:DUF1822 family protein n=1 Tax=Leptolyngbya sp. FACHB-321 TaxID=2692807 RepID=UPI001681E32C|nr:DUF1822 family protein [Leptolyngbya sp. FACHB-321]MBD2038238.1 DUF1822 family protein [Leptolyngbya sp. FACHB-321]
MTINKHKRSSKSLFILQSSQKEFEQIQVLFESGELSEILGTQVMDVGIVPESQSSEGAQISLNLSQWLQGIFEEGWEPIETLFSRVTTNPASSFRSFGDSLRRSNADHLFTETSRGKILDLGIQLAHTRVALLVTPMSTESNEEISIRLQVYPANGQIHLPPGLQLTVLDEFSTAIPELKAEARTEDNYIQLEFSGKLRERFSVEVAFGAASITEEFLI